MNKAASHSAHSLNGDRLGDDGFHVKCSCGWEDPEGVPVTLVHAAWEQHVLDEMTNQTK